MKKNNLIPVALVTVISATLGMLSSTTLSAAEKTEEAETFSVAASSQLLQEALAKGAPHLSAGEYKECLIIYLQGAEALTALPAHQRSDLDSYLLSHAVPQMTNYIADDQTDFKSVVKEVRSVLRYMLNNHTFQPRVEAAMPAEFPPPGPVGKVITKKIPSYRMARSQGGNAFGTLFQHIQKNSISMTTPVEMNLNTQTMNETDQAFMYESVAQGQLGNDGKVEVLDTAASSVLSIGLRGNREANNMLVAKVLIEQYAESNAIPLTDKWRVWGYNSPRTPDSQKFYEVQVIIADPQ